MSRFWNYLKDQNATKGDLPLIHTTDLFRFREIQKNSRLIPTPCDVYEGESLLYFFYGRPSYRPHLHKTTLTAKSFLPVCLVFSQDTIDKAIRVMPFDSGAFSRKMMHPPMHDDMTLEQFELTANPNAPMQIVKRFYKTENNYYNCKAVSSDSQLDEYEELEVDAYYRLINHRSNSPFDDRVSAIEIQLKDAVNLQGSLEVAILPQPYLDNPDIVNQIESLGGLPIGYRVGEEYIPREMQGSIYEKLTDYFESKNIL